MEALARQLLAEFYGCDAQKIDDVKFIEAATLSAIRKSHAAIISHNFHKFTPCGVSGIVVIAESHVAIHCWPEYNYAAVDIFTCGKTVDPRFIRDQLQTSLNPGKVSSRELQRGLIRAIEENPQKPVGHNS